MIAFSLLGNSDHVLVSVSIDFLSNSKEDANFHLSAFDYSHADLGGLCDDLRYFMWDILKLSAYAAAEFCECVQVGIDAYIIHHEYKVKSHSFPWFSAACAAKVNCSNHFFCLYQ